MSHADHTAKAQVGPGTPPAAGQPTDDSLDPELVQLAAPPRLRRWAALVVMAATVVAMLGLVRALSSDMAYALQTPEPRELGRVNALSSGSLESNRFVHVEGVPTLGRAVRFERGLAGSHRVFPLAGQALIFVQTRDVGKKTFARSEFSGRLVRFEDLGARYAELLRTLQEQTDLNVSEEAFLLMDGQQPGDYLWTWLVGLLCAAFALLDAYLIVRWFKPLRWTQVPPSATTRQ